LNTNEIDAILKFEQGSDVYITKGNSVGRIGILSHIERHPGSFDIAHMRDARGNHFATRLGNVFVIGLGKKPILSLPKGAGIKKTNLEQRDG